MAESVISIITEWDNSFGWGHIQRMTNLLMYLNTQKRVLTFIINQKVPSFIEESIRQYFVPEIPRETSLIIRDMRDSTVKEMSLLKKCAPVLAIDDCGEGRKTADLAIDLLPNLMYKDSYKEKNFIYGYSFTRSFLSMNIKFVHQEFDIAFYPGYTIQDEYISRVLSYLPSSLSCVILASDSFYLIRNGHHYPVNKSYAEILLSSRVLISHFGISLFEGALCGCGLISINPTQYHSDLSDIAAPDFNLQNLGTREDLGKEKLQQAIRKAMHDGCEFKRDPACYYTQLKQGPGQLFQHIVPFLNE